jgi:hypothetical protein
MYRMMQIILISSIALAQFDWEENGIAVRQGNHIEWLRTADIGNQGEIIFAWSDTRDGGRDVYAKKIDVSGQELWGNDGDGILIVSAYGRQEDPILISDGNGGAYVMWKDYRTEPDDGDFYAQYVLSDGTLAWDSQGVPLTTGSGPQGAPNMSSREHPDYPMLTFRQKEHIVRKNHHHQAPFYNLSTLHMPHHCHRKLILDLLVFHRHLQLRYHPHHCPTTPVHLHQFF